MKNVENFKFEKLSEQEMMIINGGKGWGDLFWMLAEDILEGWIDLSTEILEYHVENGGEDARIAIRLTH